MVLSCGSMESVRLSLFFQLLVAIDPNLIAGSGKSILWYVSSNIVLSLRIDNAKQLHHYSRS